MKEYAVNIREISEKIVTIEANSIEEALGEAEEGWLNGHTLTVDDFIGVEFTSEEDGKSYKVSRT